MVVDKVLGQGGEQFGIDGRVARPDVIDRVDDAAGEEITPHPVDDRLGEVRIVLRGQPLRQKLTPSLAVRQVGGL